MQNRNINERRPETPATRGFSAHLKSASLWDLVQIECLSRSRRSMQVVGEGGVGYLYFDRGRIVHATSGQTSGEPAALEILSWTNGSFQSCDRPWPEEASITASLEALLLRAAQLRDESAASNLVAFPGRTSAGAGDQAVQELEIIEPETEPEVEGEMRGSNTDDAITGVKEHRALRPEIAGDFTVVMRLAPTGAIISNRGGSEEMAETVAYVQRLLQLTGELLGLGELSAMECTFVEGRCLIFADSADETVALRPRSDGNLQPLRERLGL